MEVRILPMSHKDEEFIGKSIEEIQNDYFLKSLINEYKGYYEYQVSGIEAKEGDLILFQMDNQIIASALYLDILRYKVRSKEGNKGAYKFDTKSIKTFTPITKEELHKLIPEFESFNQVKQQFDIRGFDYGKLFERIKYLRQ